MERDLKPFDLEAKNPSEKALERWTSAVGIVKNSRRRFRHVADLEKRSEAVQSQVRTADDTEPIHGSTETENSLSIDTGNHEAHGRNNAGGSRKVALGWIFVITNFVLELPSAVFDQLSSVHKPQYALCSMLMSFLTLLICFGELAYKARKENVVWKWEGKSSGFYCSSHGGHQRFGAFKDVIGLVCALAQTIVTAINYAFCVQHADGPIKISVWPIIFAFCLLCSKYLENSEGRITS